jgi:hypothetical protein
MQKGNVGGQSDLKRQFENRAEVKWSLRNSLNYKEWGI